MSPHLPCRTAQRAPHVRTAPKTMPVRQAVAQMPDKIGKYVVIREVGRGRTRVVDLSHDADYGRDVAIKV